MWNANDKITVEQLGDAVGALSTAIHEVMEQRKTKHAAEQACAAMTREAASTLQRAKDMKVEAEKIKDDAAKYMQRCQASGREAVQQAEVKAQKILDEANAQKKKVDQMVAEGREHVANLKSQCADARRELETITDALKKMKAGFDAATSGMQKASAAVG